MADTTYEDKTPIQSDVSDPESESEDDAAPLPNINEEDEEAYDPDISQHDTFADDVELFPEEDEELCDFKIMEQLEGDETEFDSQSHIVQTSRIKTTRYITKYEESRALGLRSEQLRRNAPSLLPADFKKADGEFVFKDGKYPINSYDIALKELEYGRLPIIIGRPLPNGEKILIPVSKLKLI